MISLRMLLPRVLRAHAVLRVSLYLNATHNVMEVLFARDVDSAGWRL
jgi:hypothetical protein